MREYDRLERRLEKLKKVLNESLIPRKKLTRTQTACEEARRKSVIRHIVFFKLKPEISAEERKDFVRRLKELPSRVPGVLAPEIGEDFMGSARSYHAALIFGFADRAALDLYATHPNHLPVVERARQICESIVTVDFEV